MRQYILNHLKNIPGWRTSRRIVVFSVDDYGNVRLANKKARERMNNAGLKVKSRFDAYDTLETKEDLHHLYDALHSVKDMHGKPTVFTPFALPCNIDFEAILEQKSQTYSYEQLPITYKKLASKDPIAYEGAWKLWQEGIEQGIMAPQFHGREHLNVTVFNSKLKSKDKDLSIALENRSFTSLTTSKENCNVNYTAAFDFCDQQENNALKTILRDGMACFTEVYGTTPHIFMPPTSVIAKEHLPHVAQLGIQIIDANLIQRIPLGQGNYKKEINYLGKEISNNQKTMVRNIVFEPTDDRGFSWVDYTLQQIEAAFRMKKPAIISSHRVNFCGYIDEKNRTTGIKSLKELLQKIVSKWPDVEFMSAGDLGNLILEK